MRLVGPVLALGLWACGATTQGEEPRRLPNVVLFLVDDLGWADLACYGSAVHRTPRIDALARDGVRLTDAYAANPMCKASRFALQTGRYAARARSDEGRRAREETGTTLAQALSGAGYATFFAGKWHIGTRRVTPETFGYQVSVGVNLKGEPATYFHPYGTPGDPKHVDLPGGQAGEYLTDRLTDETLAFLREHRDRPFFACVSHYAVHKPWEAPPGLVAAAEEVLARTEFPGPATVPVGAASQKQHQDNAVYAAMVASVDASLGRIVDALDELGLREDTIVVFTSDNGGDSCNTRSGAVNSTSNAPLKAGKFWLYEGGIRVPTIVSWPGHLPAGTASDAVVTGTDHYPTLLELIGLPARPADHVDGVSYLPALRGEAGWERPPAYWHFPLSGDLLGYVGTAPGTAVRVGRYKLIEWYESGEVELYDLPSDPGEERDLARERPERARALLGLLRAWRAEVGAPL